MNDYAHISLYNSNFPENNLPLIKDKLLHLLSKTQSVLLRPCFLNKKSRFISVVFENTVELQTLQDNIIDSINYLRESMVQSKYKDQAEFYSKDELQNVDNFGYPFCKNLFSPHMTLVELENVDDADRVLQEIKWDKSFIINNVSLRILLTNQKGEREIKTEVFNLL